MLTICVPFVFLLDNKFPGRPGGPGGPWGPGAPTTPLSGDRQDPQSIIVMFHQQSTILITCTAFCNTHHSRGWGRVQPPPGCWTCSYHGLELQGVLVDREDQKHVSLLPLLDTNNWHTLTKSLKCFSLKSWVSIQQTSRIWRNQVIDKASSWHVTQHRSLDRHDTRLSHSNVSEFESDNPDDLLWGQWAVWLGQDTGHTCVLRRAQGGLKPPVEQRGKKLTWS